MTFIFTHTVEIQFFAKIQREPISPKLEAMLVKIILGGYSLIVN